MTWLCSRHFSRTRTPTFLRKVFFEMITTAPTPLLVTFLKKPIIPAGTTLPNWVVNSIVAAKNKKKNLNPCSGVFNITRAAPAVSGNFGAVGK